MRIVVGITLVGVFGLAACLANFDQFLSPPDAGKTDGAIDSGTAAPVCDAGATCTSTAKTCGDGCRDAGAMCVAGCNNNGCKNNCNQTQNNCVTKCRTDCVTCAGSGCSAVCQDASN